MYPNGAYLECEKDGAAVLGVALQVDQQLVDDRAQPVLGGQAAHLLWIREPGGGQVTEIIGRIRVIRHLGFGS